MTSLPLRIIDANAETGQYWLDLWQFRELFLFLAWRDLKVRYRQTWIGVAWAVIRPLITMGIFTMIFGGIAGLASPNGPYALMVFAGLLPWQLFSSVVASGSSSVLGSAALLTKVYFPRVILVASGTLVCLVDFFINLLLWVLIGSFFGIVPGIRWLFLFPLLGLGIAFSLGLSLWLSALSVRFRDFVHITPFFLQLLQYISPGGFSSHLVPEKWRFVFSCNPLVGLIDGFRWVLLGGEASLFYEGLIISTLFSLLVLFSGFFFFRRQEMEFADII